MGRANRSDLRQSGSSGVNAPFPSDKLQRFGKLFSEYQRRVAKDQQSKRGWYDENGVRQGGLIAFVRYFWSVLEPETTFVDGWPLWAMCEHLEAVTFGEITRLLMNVPPGFMKSMLVDVFWPAWEWGPMKKTHYRYIAFSYSASLTERDNDRFRTLIASEPYQRLYGPMKTKTKTEQMTYEETDEAGKVTLRNKTTIKVINTRTGWKLASSVGGVATGERGDRIIIDDPHSVQEAESERVREETVRWFRESISSRFNDLATGALVIIMQRVHDADVSGVVLDPENNFDYCHVCIPWNFDPLRAFSEGQLVRNQIGWADPRADEDDQEANKDEPAWEDRFSAEAMERTRREIGPYGWASQYDQSPKPRGQGIFDPSWWQLWDPPDGKFPAFEFVVASLDGAFTEDEENDPSALTVWGTFVHPETKRNSIMLIRAWRKHLGFSAERFERLQIETIIDGKRWMPEGIVPGMSDDEVKRRNAWFKRRTMSKWGLVEHVQDTCKEFKVDLLLIENKASGRPAAQEIANRYGLQRFGIQLCDPKGDKLARALSVQPTFSQGLVYAPERDWSDLVIRELEAFPRGKYDDLTDSTTQVMKYFRDAGLAMTDEEVSHEEYQRALHRPQKRALYPV
jgi:predicted phage terminase large subunit-like protein